MSNDTRIDTIHVTYSINACFVVHVTLFNIPHKIICIQIERSPIPVKVCKFRPLLRAYDIWPGRDPYRAILWHGNLVSGILSKGIPYLAIIPCTALYDPFTQIIALSNDRYILLYILCTIKCSQQIAFGRSFSFQWLVKSI